MTSYPQLSLELLYSFSPFTPAWPFSFWSGYERRWQNTKLHPLSCVLSSDSWDFIVVYRLHTSLRTISFISHNPTWYKQVWWVSWASGHVSGRSRNASLPPVVPALSVSRCRTKKTVWCKYCFLPSRFLCESAYRRVRQRKNVPLLSVHIVLPQYVGANTKLLLNKLFLKREWGSWWDQPFLARPSFLCLHAPECHVVLN